MPVVILRRGGIVTDRNLVVVAAVVPKIVAEALTCEEASLSPEEVEVLIPEYQENLGTTFHRDFSVTVLANDYPSRAVNLEDRAKSIATELRELLPSHIDGSVWVRLAPAAYCEF